MSQPTDLTRCDNVAQLNTMKRTHEMAGLGHTGEFMPVLGRRAYSDDDTDSGDGSLGNGRPSTPGPKPGKKTRGRVKINMEFIDNKLRRYTTFSKRKSGIMKKAHELATLTGTQVMLLVASETGHVYTFATRKLQPILSSEAGKQLIQTCLNSPDPPESTITPNNYDQQRMSAQGFEEPDLSYAPAEETKEGLMQKTFHAMHGGQIVSSTQNDATTSTNTQIHSSPPNRINEVPMNLIAMNNTNSNSSRGQVATIHIPGTAYTIMSGPSQLDARTLQISQGDSQLSRSSSSSSSTLLAQPGIFTQPAGIVHETINDGGQIAFVSPYKTIQRQLPVPQVLWTPAAALHTPQITVMHQPSKSDEKKDNSRS